MAASLAVYYIFHLNKLKELQIIRDYRKMREKCAFADDANFELRQIEELSRRYNTPTESINELINYWMHNCPLKFIKFFRDKKLIALIKNLQREGKLIVVYSDYPVKDKLEKIGLSPDYQFYSEDKEIRCIKPAPQGLLKILEITETKPKDALFIGDRYSKDGLCAKSAGVPFIILSKYKLLRKL